MYNKERNKIDIIRRTNNVKIAIPELKLPRKVTKFPKS